MEDTIKLLDEIHETIENYNNVSNNAYIDLEKLDDNFEQIENELRAFHLIKDHKIEAWRVMNSEDYDDYINNYCFSKIEIITLEEYKLLRKVLK